MIKIFELFAGIGAPRKALDNLGIEYESLGFSEIDKHAINSYCAIHNDSPDNNYGDISKIEKLPLDIFLLCHGSPCTNFSAAGNRKGGDKESGTASSLMWETVRLIEQSRPKVVLWENVPNVLEKVHIHNYNEYIKQLTKLGYNSHTKVLNSTDFGIPQNRNRIFVVSIHESIDNKFDFANLEKIKTRPLSEFVDFTSYEEYKFKIKTNDKNKTKELQTPTVIDTSYPTSTTRRGRHQENEYTDLCPTLTTTPSIEVVEWYSLDTLSEKGQERVNLQKENYKLYNASENEIIWKLLDINNLMLRKITSLECYKLMGFSEKDHQKAIKVSTENQLIKQAGNSIVVDVLEAIFKELFFNQGENRKGQMTLF